MKGGISMNEQLLEKEKQLREQLRQLDSPMIQILGKRTCMVKTNMKEQLSTKGKRSDKIKARIDKINLKLDLLQQLYAIERNKRDKNVSLQQEIYRLENQIAYQQDALAMTNKNYLLPDMRNQIVTSIHASQNQLKTLNNEATKYNARKPLEYYETRIYQLDALKQRLTEQLHHNVINQESQKLPTEAVTMDETLNPTYDETEANYRNQVYTEVNGILDASVGDTKGREQFLGILGSFHHMFHKFGNSKKNDNQKKKI